MKAKMLLPLLLGLSLSEGISYTSIDPNRIDTKPKKAPKSPLKRFDKFGFTVYAINEKNAIRKALKLRDAATN